MINHNGKYFKRLCKYTHTHTYESLCYTAKFNNINNNKNHRDCIMDLYASKFESVGEIVFG